MADSHLKGGEGFGGGRRRSLPKVPVIVPSNSNRNRHYNDDADDSSPEYSPVRSPTSPWFPPAPVSPGMWPDHRQSGASAGGGGHVPPTFAFSGEPVRDQFDEFLYKSKHICSMPPQNSAPYSIHHLPPEVNIEVPSDSDSSRRPSKASFGSFSCSSPATASNPGSIQNFHGVIEGDDDAIKVATAAAATVKRTSTKRSQKFKDEKHIMTSNLLAARPNLDRRSSHTGVTGHAVSLGVNRRGSHAPPRTGGQAAAAAVDGHHLDVPHARSRGSSLPGNFELVNQVDMYRLRNFTLEGKRVVNRGDSLKARSNHSINSTASSAEMRNTSPLSTPKTHSGEDWSGNNSATSSRRVSRVQSRRGSFAILKDQLKAGLNKASGQSDKLTRPASPPKQYRVAMLGGSGVGKSSLTSQFLSSDHMNTYDSVEDDVQKVVSLCVDGKEAQLVFIDHAHADMSVENQVSTYSPHGFMIVYAVNEPETLQSAERILRYLKKEKILKTHAVILVANKTDLVRSRAVSTSTGKSMAVKYNCKYIETSPGINHNVDELLVGMLAQIQLRDQSKKPISDVSGQESDEERSPSVGLKMLNLFLEKVGRHDNKSKSCGNLHVL